MHKPLVCVLMISLLLTGCAGGGGVSRAEETALAIRSAYLSTEECQGTAEVEADYGKRIYRYEMIFSWTPETCSMTLTAPETVAGISAHLDGESGAMLEYEDLILETGPLDERGLTPMGAIPTLLEELRKGYLDQCAMEGEEVVRLHFRDPELRPGQGAESTLWVDAGSCALLRGELSRDGARILQCSFPTFRRNLNHTSGETK